MLKIKYQWLVLLTVLISLPFHAGAERVVLCEKGPCKDSAIQITQPLQALENGITYYAGHGVFIDLFPGFDEMYVVLGGWCFVTMVIEKKQEYHPHDWNYKIPFSGISGFDTLYQVNGDDIIGIYYYGDPDYYDDDDSLKGTSFYQVFITHEKMDDDKRLSLLVTGFTLEELKAVLGSIQLGTPWREKQYLQGNQENKD